MSALVTVNVNGVDIPVYEGMTLADLCAAYEEMV